MTVRPLRVGTRRCNRVRLSISIKAIFFGGALRAVTCSRASLWESVFTELNGELEFA
jgi:hypothetical protein